MNFEAHNPDGTSDRFSETLENISNLLRDVTVGLVVAGRYSELGIFANLSRFAAALLHDHRRDGGNRERMKSKSTSNSLGEQY
jgi:hypothetical protein